MCGIVGYIGKKPVVPVLIEGLKRLEYRGYDSAGIAVYSDTALIVQKIAGRVARLEDLMKDQKVASTIGIAHTRWATHGEPTDKNAHPHTDCKGRIAVVHNGIIENCYALRRYLKQKGHKIRTETDTEVIAHLIEENYEDNLLKAVRIALSEVEGTYGLAVISLDHPREIVCARNGSPLVLGDGGDEFFVASDVAPIVPYTRQVVYLEDGELVSIKDTGFTISTLEEKEITPKIEEISWTLGQIEKDGYSHFMLKEIFEQPSTLRNAIRGRLNMTDGTARLDGLDRHHEALESVEKIVITACGTAWHAGLIGEYMLEEMTRVPVEVEYASEFRYRSPVVDKKTILFAISQSGETSDTLAALKEAKRRGATALGVCNVVGSTIARATDGGVYIHAGPEIGVASTKAFTSQIMVLALISLLMGRMRTISVDKGRGIIKAIEKIPEQVARILELDKKIKEIALDFYKKKNFLFLGRGYNFPVALEGALKLKEISYIHAEGYPAAEMKHGPIALIDEDMPVVFVAIRDHVFEKILSNIEEVKSRRGVVIAITTEGDKEIQSKVKYCIPIPKTIDFLTPLLTVIPLQLLAYHIATLKGFDVDRPRNLAKSVTVE
ncbi:MAG: glutamine--fructose-6-phosphate transaminase (isomerizing) [bacterium]